MSQAVDMVFEGLLGSDIGRDCPEILEGTYA